MNTRPVSPATHLSWRRRTAACGLGLLLVWAGSVHAEDSPMGLTISVPNGYATVSVDDLTVMSTAGAVRWTRVWDGQE